jgi:raffinose/stachyose/melibiose transport system substrate-binding protein
MKKALIFLVMIVFTATFLGVGCKTTSTENSSAATTAAQVTTATSAETTAKETASATTEKSTVKELTLWQIGQYPQALSDMISDFEKESGIKMNVIVNTDPAVVTSKWVAGERPDIFNQVSALANFLPLEPAKNFVDLTSEPWVENSLPGILSVSTLDNKVYGAVIDAYYLWGVFYNKDIFNKLTSFTEPKGWAEFLELAGKVKDTGNTPIVVGGGDQWPLQFIPMFFWADFTHDGSFQKNLNANKASYTDEKMVESYKHLKELYDKGYLNKDVLSATYEKETAKLMDGEAAMLLEGSWVLQTMVDNNDLATVNSKIGVFPISENGNTVTANPSSSWYVCKTGDSAKEEASKEFLRYITGPRYQKYIEDTKATPTLKGFNLPADIPDPLKKLYELSNNNLTVLLDSPATVPNFGLYLQEMLMGKLSPEQAAAATEDEWIQNAKTAKLQGF